MFLLKIVFCVALQNLASPAFADINPRVVHYNPVAAVFEPTTYKACPGALVWVGPTQVFIGSNACAQSLLKGEVRAGDGKTRQILFGLPNESLGVGIIFLSGFPTSYFDTNELVLPGFLLPKKEYELRHDLPLTISNATWGPHHEVSEAEVKDKKILLHFTEELTAKEKCPDPLKIEWGPAMRLGYWDVPLIVGVFQEYGNYQVENGKCKVSLVYNSLAPAVEWIEKKVEDYSRGYYTFMKQNQSRTQADYENYIKHKINSDVK